MAGVADRQRLLFSLLVAFLVLPFSAVGASGDDIDADGVDADWPADTKLATDANSVSLHITWNATHLALGWNGTDFADPTLGADLFIYFDTTAGGSDVTRDWGGVHTLPFDADHALVVEDSSYTALIEHDGSQWTDAGAPDSAYVGWSDVSFSEFTIPWSALGAPQNLSLIAYAQQQKNNNVWTSFPSLNPASSSGSEVFTHWYQLNDTAASIAPNTIPVMPADEIIIPQPEAGDINLAIVFHQHQPYYRNLMTGMYEMPWVRVHGVTEYVDSPGILSRYPDTNITFNLVPSLIQQITDYHENRTFDTHSEWASRDWPVDADVEVSGYPNMTSLELHTMQLQSFWNSGWIYNVSADDPVNGWLYPASQRYSQLYDATLHNLKPHTIMDDVLLQPQQMLDLMVLWNLFQLSPYHLRGEYDELLDTPAQNSSIEALFMQNGNYSPADLSLILDYQHEQMGSILPMYSTLAERGQVELTTSPYYHPIMPLLMMDGWTYEDGIDVDKESWPDEVEAQLTRGMDLFENELGYRPVGMWPSEQAVSPAMVQPVADVGVQWMVSDELNLANSLLEDGSQPDSENASQLATPWTVSGVNGDEVAVFFRDRVISDRIAFQYGFMSPEDAVADFTDYILDMRQQVLDEGGEPSEKVLTIALDGENWLFMSEFGQNDNGRMFLDELYATLEDFPGIQTVTPSQFLALNSDHPKIETISTGSWIDGTLSTWAGEAEESLAWQRLIEAKAALGTVDSSHSGYEQAQESLYIAEGSDWYWWYGLDQDSGYDELWDLLFKTHLANIYTSVDLDLPVYLQDLWTSPAVAATPSQGTIQPQIDGIALPGEWDGAAIYDGPDDAGWLDVERFHMGYDTQSLYLRVDLGDDPKDVAALFTGSPSTADPDPDLAFYFMTPNAVNFNEVGVNFRSYYGSTVLGFPAQYMLAVNFDQLLSAGQGKFSVFEARGDERWVLSHNSVIGGMALDEVIEFQIPYSDLGLAPRYSTRLKLVAAEAHSLDSGTDLEVIPAAPAEAVVPDLEQWLLLLDMQDAVGDELGKGDLQYPQAADFTPGEGLFDVQRMELYQSAWNAKFVFTMGEITNYWSMMNGFSHQIVQIYVDRDNITGSGSTQMLEGANAEIHPDWAWEVVISATGEPGALKAVRADTGESLVKGIEVSGDAQTNTITLIISKDVIGEDVGEYRYTIVFGSQDGYGPGKWRDVDADVKTWALGGGDSPAADDGVDYDPNVLDIVLEDEVDQLAMLADYEVDGHRYAQLSGITIPEVPQQVFGVDLASVEANSAILKWSTTKPAIGEVTCVPIAPVVHQNMTYTSAVATTQALSLTGLTSNNSYECTLSIEGVEPVMVGFITSAIADTTAPEILNVNIELISSQQIRVTWYTSEATTEMLNLDCWWGDAALNEAKIFSAVALDKNHDVIWDVNLTHELCYSGNWVLTVESIDASGNRNTSGGHEFTVVKDDGAEQNGGEDGEQGSEPSQTETRSLLNDSVFLVGAGLIGVFALAMLVRAWAFRRE